jgi:hypothetical protein
LGKLLLARKVRITEAIDKLLDLGILLLCLVHFVSLKTLEFGKFPLCTRGGTGASERLSKAVVNGRSVRVNLKSLFILRHGVVVLALTRIKDAELEIRVSVSRI